MAKFVLKTAQVTVNSKDLSDHASSATIETNTDEVDVTAFTAAAYREFTDGFKDATITVDFFQDFAGSSVDETLWPLYDNGSTFEISVIPNAGTVSPTNPEYALPVARLYTFSPIAGGVGDAATASVTFRNGGTQGLTRATA
jgi:hypothetical protein